MAFQTSSVPLHTSLRDGVTRNVPIESRENDTFCFSHFRLIVRERLLLKDGIQVSVGSRAFDLLLALVERAGETVNRQELFTRVWPDVIVSKVNLRVHIAGLRKLLGEGQGGKRFIISVACRGYRFVANVSRIQPADTATNLSGYSGTPLSVRTERKCAVFATARTLVTDFDNTVCFVDLAGINDPGRVATAVALALRCEVNAQQSLSGVVAYLRNKELLLAFDNCDRAFAGVAQLTERLLNEAPLVHVLIRRRKALHPS
jgi:DNA-binding winged helix-turn-helix (wHTH) protein